MMRKKLCVWKGGNNYIFGLEQHEKQPAWSRAGSRASTATYKLAFWERECCSRLDSALSMTTENIKLYTINKNAIRMLFLPAFAKNRASEWERRGVEKNARKNVGQSIEPVASSSASISSTYTRCVMARIFNSQGPWAVGLLLSNWLQISMHGSYFRRRYSDRAL